ncbi:MAG: SDR family oxidoreductase [Anaerolineae bacterium]
MAEQIPLIGTGTLTRECLAGQTAIVTGAGRGIGYETARALAWLRARVAIAEIDKKSGAAAAARIEAEMGRGSARFVHTDVGDERSVARLARAVPAADVVFNNATLARVGAVQNTSVRDWDDCYHVNLRGPVLLARAFLPGMLRRRRGVFVCVASSGAAPFMGPYEVCKTAQVELANTLAAELEGTGVIAFTIGPGLVATPGAQESIQRIAPLYGKTVAEFLEMSKDHIISVEEAGAGFAAAVALAEQFAGQEIGSPQALVAAGITFGKAAAATVPQGLSKEETAEALDLCREVRGTLAEQAEGWGKRPLFERQWVQRDFRKYAGRSVDQWLELLGRLEAALAARDAAAIAALDAPVAQLAAYYEHLLQVLRGWEKDPAKLQQGEQALQQWRETAARLADLLAHSD